MRGKLAATPTASGHVANKGYVDSVAGGLTVHQAVVVATTGNGTLATAYENGDTLDGIVLSTNDRILLKDQTSADENGVYTVEASGEPTRATDLDTVTSGEIALGAAVYVSRGTVNSGSRWVTTESPAVVDTNDWTWGQFSDSGNNTASQIDSVAAGNLVATNVQDALDELDDEKMPLAGGAFSGAVTTSSTFDGRDVATDGTKLDGIEALANVTDTANVTSSLPVADSTSLVTFGTDKEMRIDVGAITDTTVRVLTMPDSDIDLTPGSGSFATEAEGNLAGTAVQPEDNSSNYGMMTHGGATMSVSTGGVAVAVIGTTTAKGDATGWTVGADGTFTATFAGTKTVRVQAVIGMAPIATNTDNLTLHVYVDGSSVFESAANDIDDGTSELFEVDFMTNVANGEVVQLYVENQDTVADIVIDAYTDRINTVPSSGWFSVMAV